MSSKSTPIHQTISAHLSAGVRAFLCHITKGITQTLCQEESWKFNEGKTRLQQNYKYANYSDSQEFLGNEAGFSPYVQSQHGISFLPAATQLILMNVCFMDFTIEILAWPSFESFSMGHPQDLVEWASFCECG